jgi:hypothetical protein
VRGRVTVRVGEGPVALLIWRVGALGCGGDAEGTIVAGVMKICRTSGAVAFFTGREEAVSMELR